jgi:hypothetical protein
MGLVGRQATGTGGAATLARTTKQVEALGRRDAVENSDLLHGLIASAARHSHRSIVLSSFCCSELAEPRRRSIRPYLVFGPLWVEAGCRDVLRRHLADHRFGFNVEAHDLPHRASSVDGIRLGSPRQHLAGVAG